VLIVQLSQAGKGGKQIARELNGLGVRVDGRRVKVALG